MAMPRPAGWTRRTFGLALGRLTCALTAVACIDGAAARNRRKRKPKRKKRPATPSACTRACGSACAFCFHRAAASLLCGDGSGVACDEACATDDDCTDPLRRYCLVGSEDPATGTITHMCLSPGGHCGQVEVCAA